MKNLYEQTEVNELHTRIARFGPTARGSGGG